MKDISLYDRVTSVLAPFSGMDKIPKHILDAAATRGTHVHALCNGIIEGIEVEVPEEYKGYVDSFKQWAEGKVLLPSPGRMFDDEGLLTGEYDGTIIFGNEKKIFDLKTSQKESCTWKYQGAAYAHLLDGGNTTYQEFVMLNKEGKFPKTFTYSYEENIFIFVKCLDLYRLFFKNKKTDIEGYEYL